MVEPMWQDGALRGLERIVDDLEALDPASATALGERLIACVDGLGAVPHRGAAFNNGRRQMVSVAPCILTYLAGDHDLAIVAVRAPSPGGAGA